MFCDEPTSGLDSYMAQNIVEVLFFITKRKSSLMHWFIILRY